MDASSSTGDRLAAATRRRCRCSSTLPGNVHLTYCTNIHAGESWSDIRARLDDHVPPRSRRQVRPIADRHRLALVRVAATATRGEPQALAAFDAFLAAPASTSSPSTLSRTAFHGTRVKETGLSSRIGAARSDCVSPADSAPISGRHSSGRRRWQHHHRARSLQSRTARRSGAAATMAASMVAATRRICIGSSAVTGKRIALALEPEPCCFLETANEASHSSRINLSQARSARAASRRRIRRHEPRSARTLLRRHLGICYDVCHGAVEYRRPGRERWTDCSPLASACRRSS